MAQHRSRDTTPITTSRWRYVGCVDGITRRHIIPANRNVTSVETYSGQYVDLIHPDPATIRLEDIAVGLSNTARFAGQISRFYSVAEHAVRVSEMVPREFALAALHHDSHEAYIGDIIAPLKAALRRMGGEYIDLIAVGLDNVIAAALVPGNARIMVQRMHTSVVKEADDEAMYHEAAALKWSHGVGEHWLNDAARVPWAGIGWNPARAERMFVARHQELTR